MTQKVFIVCFAEWYESERTFHALGTIPKKINAADFNHTCSTGFFSVFLKNRDILK